MATPDPGWNAAISPSAGRTSSVTFTPNDANANDGNADDGAPAARDDVQTENVTGVMTAMEKADLGFTTLLAIRGKLMDAYEEIKNIAV